MIENTSKTSILMTSFKVYSCVVFDNQTIAVLGTKVTYAASQT